MTAGGGVDVLAVLDRAALAIRSDFATRGNPDPDKPLREARKAIAELIAADKEYDEAYASQLAIFHNRSASGAAINNAIRRVETATARRASALAALESQP